MQVTTVATPNNLCDDQSIWDLHHYKHGGEAPLVMTTFSSVQTVQKVSIWTTWFRMCWSNGLEASGETRTVKLLQKGSLCQILWSTGLGKNQLRESLIKMVRHQHPHSVKGREDGMRFNSVTETWDCWCGKLWRTLLNEDVAKQHIDECLTELVSQLDMVNNLGNITNHEINQLSFMSLNKLRGNGKDQCRYTCIKLPVVLDETNSVY